MDVCATGRLGYNGAPFDDLADLIPAGAAERCPARGSTFRDMTRESRSARDGGTLTPGCPRLTTVRVGEHRWPQVRPWRQITPAVAPPIPR